MIPQWQYNELQQVGTDYTDHESFINNWLETMKETAGEDIAWDTEIAIREEFSTLDWIMEGLLTRSGFRIEKAEYPTEFLAIYVCIKTAN